MARDGIENNADVIQNLDAHITDVNQNTGLLVDTIALLNKFNVQNINLNISNYEIFFLNLILLILKKLLINKKNIYV